MTQQLDPAFILQISAAVKLALQSDFASIKREVDSIKADVASIKGDVASIKGEVASIKGEVASIKREVDSIKGEVDSIKGEVASLKIEFKTEIKPLVDALDIMRVQQHNSRLSPSEPPMELPLPTGLQEAPEQPTCLAQIMVSVA